MGDLLLANAIDIMYITDENALKPYIKSLGPNDITKTFHVEFNCGSMLF